MLKYKALQFNMFGVNTYVVWNPESGDAAIIDPGMTGPAEEARLDQFVADNHLNVGLLLLTHMHVDHLFGADYVRRRYGVGLRASEADAFLGRQAPAQCRMFGLDAAMVQPVEADSSIANGERIALGGEEAVAIAVPGHSPGSLAYHFPDSGFVATGDALFRGSIGRTDLVAGNHTLLVDSIRSRLLTLPDATIVLPGHGDPTAIAAERRANPYLL